MRIRILTLIFLLGLLSGCGNSEPPIASYETQIWDDSADARSEAMAKWARSCALCHVTGVSAAPKVGDDIDWQPRLAKGRNVLIAHTIDGFNRMPPLGYCMDCTTNDFLILIDFMSGESK